MLSKIGIKSRCLTTELNLSRHRVQAIDDFRKGRIQVLLCNDSSVRGFDVSDTDAVVIFDIPYPPSEFVHGVGRCGRNGKSGKAISIVDDTGPSIINFGGRKCILDERAIFSEIQKSIGRKISIQACPVQVAATPKKLTVKGNLDSYKNIVIGMHSNKQKS